ncbi:MAG TPA: 4-(cytidine 5'-diphospho)-2-C-methyl-D-erythritol kinase [Ignavibacteriales bacterium]|nr:4-(cytidine 5'-diphospho)-2-C-methyl-D-erythritol kinase [Ignavibacteriales bacterium]
MDNIVINSLAKINIGLNIISKRSDGYHNLETIFYPLNLFDEIRFTKSNEFIFKSNDEMLSNDRSNLICRAINLLENEFNLNLPVEVYLKKNIPIGAGLGGGSSNAASTLVAIPKLFEIAIDKYTLLELSLRLGSDVPYFLNPVPAFAESRGEKIIPLNFPIEKYILIVNPAIHISTKWAFGLIKPKQPVVSLKSLINKTRIDVDEVMLNAGNDFEKIVFDHFPEIMEIKQRLLEFGAIYSMMTGTGSTVWALFDNEESAHQSELYFKGKNYFTFMQDPI